MSWEAVRDTLHALWCRGASFHSLRASAGILESMYVVFLLTASLIFPNASLHFCARFSSLALPLACSLACFSSCTGNEKTEDLTL